MGQQLVLSSRFLNELDSSYDNERKSFSAKFDPRLDDLDDNYRAFRKTLRNKYQKILFNCSRRELVDSAAESPFLGYLIQEDTERPDNRITADENAMLFITADSKPSDSQRNNIYCSSFTALEQKRTKLFGVLALTVDDIINNSSWYNQNGIEIEKGKEAELSFKGFKKVCNTLVIKDLYVLTLDKKYNLFKILDAFIPKNKVENYSVFIYTSYDGKSPLAMMDYFTAEWKEIKAWIANNRKEEIASCISLYIIPSTNDDFHNRHILTNYVYCDSGAGLDIVKTLNITRQRENGGYASSRNNDILEQVGAQTTAINVFFPRFILGTNELVMKDYLAQIRVLNKIHKSKRSWLDNEGHVNNGPLPDNLLFRIDAD